GRTCPQLVEDLWLTATPSETMKLSLKNWRHRADPARKYSGNELPLRSELFSTDQMEGHGKTLAASHKLSTKGAASRLLTRLAENEDVLIGVHGLLIEAVQADRRIAPAGEWLLDNFYLIEEQIRTAKRHLPPGYSRELPRLRSGPNSGLPRVYDLALHSVAHGDGRLGRGTLTRSEERRVGKEGRSGGRRY